MNYNQINLCQQNSWEDLLGMLSAAQPFPLWQTNHYLTSLSKKAGLLLWAVKGDSNCQRLGISAEAANAYSKSIKWQLMLYKGEGGCTCSRKKDSQAGLQLKASPFPSFPIWSFELQKVGGCTLISRAFGKASQCRPQFFSISCSTRCLAEEKSCIQLEGEILKY